MKLAKALKEKNVLIKEIQVLKQRFQTYNSTVVGTEIPYEVTKTFADLMEKQGALVALKMKIYKANMPIQEDIFRIAELKTLITILRSTSTNNGIVKSRGYGEKTEDEYVAVYKTVAVDNMVAEFEKTINETQERIDAHNHTTEI